MKHITIVLALTAFVVSGAGAQAREGTAFGGNVYAGVLRSAYDVGDDGARGGPLVGVAVSRRLSDRFAISGNFAIARTQDVARHGGSDYFLYNDTYRLATLGGEYAVISGLSSVLLSLEAGARWRRTVEAASIGNPPETARRRGEFSVGEMLVPGITFRRQLMPRAGISLGIRDYIMSLEVPKHSPAVLLGLTIQ